MTALDALQVLLSVAGALALIFICIEFWENR